MTYFGQRLKEALNHSQHIAIVAAPSRKLASLSRDANHALVIHYRGFDSFLAAQEARRRIR